MLCHYILRYFREVPDTYIPGTFKVLHVYYYRDSDGDHLEGASEYESRNGMPGHSYNANSQDLDGISIPLIETPSESVVNGHYTYTHDGRPQYGVLNPDGSNGQPISEVKKGGYTGKEYYCRPDTDWSCVTATENGEQVIILRYYRETKGSYKIVHEYYSREKNDGTLTEGGAIDKDDGSTSETDISDSEKSQTTEPSLSFNGTLDFDNGYSYRFEGAQNIESRQAKLESTHIVDEVSQKPKYNSKDYTYHSAVYGEATLTGTYDKIIGKQWATATEDGTQIIILRYFREADDDPKPPENPGGDPGKPPKDPEDSEEPPKDPEESGTPTDPNDPDPPPQLPKKPSDTPEKSPKPENPGYPAELPDPNDPDAPDSITIWESGVAKTYIRVWDPDKEEWVWILDEDVALANAPRSGDDSTPGLWIFLTATSLVGLGTLGYIKVRKKK